MTQAQALTCSCLIGTLLTGAAVTASGQSASVNPQALYFVYQMGGPAPPAQNLYISAPVPTQFTAAISGATWLSVAPANGIAPATLVVTVRPPADATPGTLTGSIIIGPIASTDAFKLVVSVSLQIVGPAQGDLVVNPDTLVTDYQAGSPPPMLMPVTVTSTGTPAAFTLTSSTTGGGSWLSAAATSLVTPSTVYVTITPGPSILAGVYTGSIAVIPAYAGGTTKHINVTLRVFAGGPLTVTPTYLSYQYQSGGALPPAQYLNINDDTGKNSSFSVTATTVSAGMWLNVAPPTAITPTSISVGVNPAGLATGTYSGSITIRPATGAAITQIPVTLTVNNSPQLQTSPPALTFDYQTGGPAVPTQYVYVTSTGASIRFTPTVTGPTWITAPFTSFDTPAGVPVSVNPPSTTAPGTYTAVVTMTPTAGSASPLTAQVTVRVAAGNYLYLSPNNVSFAYSPGAAAPAQIVSVTSSNGSVRFQASESSSWLSLSQSSQYTPASITISAAPKGLAAGVYHDTVTVYSDEAGNSPQTIQVTLNVSSDPSFTATPFGLMFSYQIGGDAPAAQLAVIANAGGAQQFAVTAEADNGGSWLMATGGGSTPAAVAAAIDASGLTVPGTYTGNLIVTPKSGSAPPLRIPVVLSVSAGPNLRTAANSMAFQYAIGGPAAQPQKLTVGTTAGYIGFYPSVRTADGGDWLKVTPDFASAPADLTVAADPTGLSPGSYMGLIALTGVGQEDLIYFVPVTLQISDGPILTVPAQSLIFRATVGASTTAPQTIAVRSTGAPSNIQVTPSSSGWLLVNPVSAVGDVDLVVQATLDGWGAGYYLGLVTIEIPGVANSQQYVPVGLALTNPMIQ